MHNGETLEWNSGGWGLPGEVVAKPGRFHDLQIYVGTENRDKPPKAAKTKPVPVLVNAESIWSCGDA